MTTTAAAARWLSLARSSRDDDDGGSLFSTYWPERARIDTDNVHVHPAVTPVDSKLILPANPRKLPSTMQRSSNPVERDDCGVPMFSTYWPERARIDTDTVNMHPAVTPVDCECIFCSVSSYSIASRGYTTDIQEISKYMTCRNCSSQFCSRCIHELVQSVEGFKTIPISVKNSDVTYKKLIEIQREMCLAKACPEFLNKSVSVCEVLRQKGQLSSNGMLFDELIDLIEKCHVCSVTIA